MSGAGKSYAHGSSIEAAFKAMAERKAWKVWRAGWPDFLLTGDGGCEFVEVKSIGDRLSDGQVEMFAALELAGILVRVWWEGKPGSLMPWRAFHADTEASRRPPPKLSSVPKRGPQKRYNPRKLGTLERDRKRGIRR